MLYRGLLILAFLLETRAKLIKVVALGRHGNRAPSKQIMTLCPKGEKYYSQFGEPIDAKQRAALSLVGTAENYECGTYLREKYIGTLLERGPYKDDGSVFFLSERMDRNIVSCFLSSGEFFHL